jgi:membrane associated rhomboid family serine protease
LGSTRELVRLGGLVPAYVTLQHEYWRMVTSTFLHGGFLHLLFNMWALWVLGDYVESILGHVKFLLLYVVSGLAGSVLVVMASPDFQVTVGASGAIFGIFGALALYAFLYRNRDFQARALLGNVIFLLVINLAISFWGSGISWQGHVGGLIGGVALMAGYTLLGTKDPRAGFSSGDALVTGMALVVIAVLTYLQVQSAAPLLLPGLLGL